MERKIPTTFESIILSSPAEAVSETTPNMCRAKVRAFSKYANRNGSYISDQVGERLVETAINKPIVGWYDPQTGSWAGHVGPELAQAYGYVESFEGWQPFEDTDHVTRDYAVFSVVLFSEYFDAARKIVGSNQSMELNPATIKGDWVDIEGNEYFAFTQAQIYSFCVIGTKEPCFSVSAFFTKNTAQYEKLQSLVFEMRKIVEGGDVTMTDTENVVIDEEQPVVENAPAEAIVEETPATVEEPAVENTEFEAEEPAEETVEEAPAVEEDPAQEPEVESEAEPAEDYELLYNELQTKFTELQNELDAANARVDELTKANTEYAVTVGALQEWKEDASNKLAGFELQAKENEKARKAALVESYSCNLSEDEIESIGNTEELSYDELESHLAIVFSRKQLSAVKETRVPLNVTQKSDFASLMEKYKRQ